MLKYSRINKKAAKPPGRTANMYDRPKFKDPSVKIIEQKPMMSKNIITVPQPDFPISIRENFKRAYTRNNPVWVPNSLVEFNDMMPPDLTNDRIDADWSVNFREEFKDWFDVEWVFVPEAGGPIVKPGTHFLEDVTQWEKVVKFPDLNKYDFRARAKENMEGFYADKMDRIFHIDVGLGASERLVALMGGYSEAMLAMAEEPEAVRDFYFAHTEFEMKFVDLLCELYPVDMLTYHDDWGNERNTFFSEAMMEEIVFDPTKKLCDHMKSKDVAMMLHSCGKIERFLPYMVDLGFDFIQIQSRCNDFKMIKEKYGDKLGLNTGVGLDFTKPIDHDGLIAAIRDMLDKYAQGGGLYTMMAGVPEELLWDGIMEIFYYSRELYEKQQGK